MTASYEKSGDLPWGRMALAVVGVFLILLVVQSLRHDGEEGFTLMTHVRPKGAVDDLSPIEWEGELPTEKARFVVVVRDPKMNGVEGELARSPFLEDTSWSIPKATMKSWTRVKIRVYVVDDPDNMSDEWRREATLRTPETVAWKRD
ncbi:MAG: hypothetical protein O2816_05500 [Planctomycetota bacterium]|nr:hypothetical protein [Planctomycetota bacterium]